MARLKAITKTQDMRDAQGLQEHVATFSPFLHGRMAM
jgi:hypothetical protein